ncbi:low temperature requirement protein A [Micromonospora parathelypteridis]|uniref:Low temperature requirement protein LtrA n=1 Tax=Micromonospora parathelypteridis TaxID=1839617 RepID=A0A840VZ40_9ACTN|nr:low temperature requirement protein A [Micromonospora parathelypteridis]MBB5481236.1 low temperature requirement protein LtrA [Micromonospora parathelypteridis]GGO19458.1 membrane protein [Micromonospora parathelypteridis]
MTVSRSVRPFYRPMRPRRRDEPHRAATPLELFFDLCFVVAVAQAASSLHHDVAEGHLGHAAASYAMVFFAIWWSWVNFTWFASAYDTDDDVYRITTLVQISGALILAAGVPRAFTDGDFAVITYGYVVMRLAAVVHWSRAAAGDPTHRVAARRYAIGVTVVQLGWLSRLLLPDEGGVASFVLLALADLLVPAVAERRGMTPWHPQHITERYGLFTLIVLGEAVLAISVAIQTGLDAGEHGLWSLAAAGAVIVFALWWLYFDRPIEAPARLPYSLIWGYGHYLIFAAIAAVGAGLVVSVDVERHVAHISGITAGYAVATPIAVFLLTVWVLHVRRQHHGVVVVAFPVVALLALLAPLGPVPVYVLAALLVGLVTLTVLLRSRDVGPSTTAAGADPA